MVEAFQQFLQSTPGKITAICCSICAVFVAMYFAKSSFKSETPDTAFSAMYIDTDTGKAFRHETVAGEEPPILSPYSGKRTGIRAEACYWTASGAPKNDPTWVLLNESIGKAGPTFCPDCGRLVVGHNPAPAPGKRPPPTHEEFMAHQQLPLAAAPSRNAR